MQNKIKRILFQFGPFLGLFFVILLFSILAPPEFLSFYNLKTILTQSVIVGIAALGMTLVIISGGIDLSVGSQIALGTVAVAVVMNMSGADGAQAAGGGTTLLAAGAGIGLCAFCGLIIGLI